MARPLRTWASVLGATGGMVALLVSAGTTFGSVVNFSGSALGGDVTSGAACVLVLIVLVGLVGSGVVAWRPFVGGSLMLASGALAYGWVWANNWSFERFLLLGAAFVVAGLLALVDEASQKPVAFRMRPPTVLGQSRALFRGSLALLAQDKHLLLFPALAILLSLSLGLALIHGTPAGVVVQNLPHTRGIPQSTRLVGYVSLLLGYFLVLFMIVFANVAVIGCIKVRLDGGNPTTIDGLRVSLAQLRRIVAWVLLMGSIGLVLRVLGRLDKLGSTAERMLGFTWEIATWFVVPVMIFEHYGIVETLQRSSSLVRKTWGESLTAGVGLTAFVLYLAIPALVLPFVFQAALGWPAASVGLMIAAAYWLCLGVLATGLSGVLRAALYVYAAEGRLPPIMNDQLVRAAFLAR